VSRLLRVAGLATAALLVAVFAEAGARSLISRPPPAPLFAAFTPDGTRALTGGVFAPARIWYVDTGALLHTFGSNDSPQTAALSRDGTRVVTTYGDGTVRVWDSESGDLLRLVKRNEVGWDWGSGETLSPDNKLLVTSSDGSDHLRVWDVASGSQVATINCSAGPAVFSPDGKQMVACDQALLWDVGTRRIRHRLKTDFEHVNASAFSPNGRQLATAGDTATLWDARTGRRIHSLQTGPEVTWAVAFSPSGRRVVVAGARDADSVGASVHVWDTHTGRRLYALRGHRDRVIAAGFNVKGTRILTVGDDCTARIWNAANGKNLLVLRDSGCIRAATFSPDGTRIITLSGKGVASVWDARSGQLMRSYHP
jgi:WD40 repeat protein